MLSLKPTFRSGVRALVISLNALASGGPATARARPLLPGMMVKVTRVAPLGDPIAIEFQNQCVSLRKAEALEVMVELARGRRWAPVVRKVVSSE